MPADTPRSTDHLPRPDPSRGVFETILVVRGRPVELDAHLERFFASARELFGAPTLARIAGPARTMAEARARELDGSGAESAAGLARLRLTLAPDGRGRIDLSSTIAEVDPGIAFPPHGAGPRLAPIAVEGGLGRHKWADRRLLEQIASELDGVQPLIVDTDGSVLEAERANVFAISSGTLLTPPADGRILPGIARARVLEIASQLGLEPREAQLHLDDLEAADAVFLTGSIRGVEPVGADRLSSAAIERIAATLRERWLGPAD